MHKKFLAGVLPLMIAGQAAGAPAFTTVQLISGHYVVSIDPNVATFDVQAQVAPGECRPQLTLESTGEEAWRVVQGNPACGGDPYAELRLNPAWRSSLRLVLRAGQVDLSASMIDSLSSLDAVVTVGDIVGAEQVRRHRLVGASLALKQDRVGIRLRVDVGAGQVSLDAPFAHVLVRK